MIDFDSDNGYSTAEDNSREENMRAKDSTGYTVPDHEIYESMDEEIEEQKSRKTYQLEIVWLNAIILALYHVLALIGIYFCIYKIKWATLAWCYICGSLCGFGVTAGAHRLWAHKSYKAKWPLKLILLIFHTMAVQNSMIVWVRDHRVHHKFTDTDADPHNSRRGFFFSHVGWLMVRKHDEVKKKGKKVNVQDLWDDPMLRFQYKYYIPLIILFSLIIPVYLPVLIWHENVIWSFLTCGILRYVLVLHFTWSINSIAHLYGTRPYNEKVSSRQNAFAAFLSFGEGWHNFHHKFPRDYRASEYPIYYFNSTKAFIDFFIWIGWAYDVQMTSPDAIARTKMRHGDGTN